MDRTIIKRNFYAELLILVIFGAIAILSSSIAVRLLTYLIALVLVIALSISELKTYSKKDYWLLFFPLYAKAICLTYVVFQVSNYPGKYIIGLIAVFSIVACLVISIIKKNIYKALSALSYKILTVLVFC